MNRQFAVKVPNSSLEVKGSPERVIKCEDYIRTKLKLSTLRADIPNNEKITYNKVIKAISAQMNELTIAL